MKTYGGITAGVRRRGLAREDGATTVRDVVVTVPKDLWGLWLDEGDLPGDDPTGEEWHFYTGGGKPDIVAGCRVYVVAHGRLRGYSPLKRLVTLSASAGIGFIRGANAVAVTIPEPIRGFRGWRYRGWPRADEVDFPDWKTEGVR